MARIFTDSVFYHLERKAPGFSHGEHQQYPYTLEKCLSAKQHYTNALRLALFARPAGRLTRALLHPIHIKNPLSAKNVKKGDIERMYEAYSMHSSISDSAGRVGK